MRLASMETEKEDTESLALFLRLFNEALSKVLGQEGYKFNPYVIMCNENGTMFLGKTVTCQWYFRECAKKQLSSVNPLEKETFKSLYSQICYASTANEYERISDTLEQICERNNIMTWWAWWKARHFHIVPALEDSVWVAWIWQNYDKVHWKQEENVACCGCMERYMYHNSGQELNIFLYK